MRVQLVPMSSAVVQVSSDQAEGIPTNMPRQAEKNEQKAAQEELASPEQLLEVRKWRGHTLRTPARRSHSHDKPFRHHLILATRPCLAQSIACSALLFFAVVFLASVAAGGDKVLRFSTAGARATRSHWSFDVVPTPSCATGSLLFTLHCVLMGAGVQFPCTCVSTRPGCEEMPSLLESWWPTPRRVRALFF